MKAALYILAALLILGLLLWMRHQYQQQFDALNSIIKEQNGVITYWQTEAGKVASTKPAAEISKSDLEEHYADITADLKDMQIKLSGVRAVLKAVVEAQGQGVVQVIHDTIYQPGAVPVILDSILIDDSYLQLSGRLKDSEFRYKYSYQDTIVAAVAWKKKGWLGKRSLEGTFRLSNPAARAISQTSILIREKPKRFYLGVGVAYNPFTNTFAPGMNAGFALIRF